MWYYCAAQGLIALLVLHSSRFSIGFVTPATSAIDLVALVLLALPPFLVKACAQP